MEPHFKVFPEFISASYAKRYELFCRNVVLDPFCGSGTSMLAAMQSGRHSIGIEIDPEYCNIIQHRLDHNTLFKTSSFLRINPAKKKINGEMVDFYNKVEHEYSSLVA